MGAWWLKPSLEHVFLRGRDRATRVKYGLGPFKTKAIVWDMIMSHYCLTLTTIGCQAPHPLSTIRLNASVHLEDDVQGDAAEAKPSSQEASFAFAIK